MIDCFDALGMVHGLHLEKRCSRLCVRYLSLCACLLNYSLPCFSHRLLGKSDLANETQIKTKTIEEPMWKNILDEP